MKYVSAVLLVLVLLLPCMDAIAQEDPLPDYTTEVRWASAEYFATTWIIFGIRYGKMMNQSVDDVAAALVEVFGPDYSLDLTPLQLLGNLHYEMMLWSEAEFDVIESSEEGFQVRTNRPWVRYFGEDGEAYGVTPSDMDALHVGIYERIASERGMVYEEKIEGNDLFITVRKK